MSLQPVAGLPGSPWILTSYTQTHTWTVNQFVIIGQCWCWEVPLFFTAWEVNLCHPIALQCPVLTHTARPPAPPVTMDRCLHSRVVAISCPPSWPPCYIFLPDTSVFSLGGTYVFSKHLPTSLGATVFWGGHLSQPHATEFWPAWDIL